LSERSSGSGTRKTILIVDDDEALRAAFSEHFEQLGFAVELAADGNEAIAQALRIPPDVIVLDLQMPRLDGWDTMRLLRTYPATAGVPVIACTGLHVEGIADRAKRAGFDAFVKKPCQAAEVERAVAVVLHPAETAAG
jgi:CheY-like chemotaxis protein